eukprot:COSAG06_NODE_40619_length_400_cov_0.827243_1_plen_22_part_01
MVPRHELKPRPKICVNPLVVAF